MRPTDRQRNGASIPNQATNRKTEEVAVPEDEATPKYQMPEELHKELLGMINQQTQAKVLLADKTIELRGAEQLVHQMNQDVTARISGFAAAHGVDPNNPSKGRWNFDIPSGVLSKVG